MYTWNTFQTAYQAATDDQKRIVDSEAITSCVDEVMGSQQIETSHRSKLIRLYALNAMQAISKEDFVTEIQNIGIPNANNIIQLLQTCVSKKHPLNTNTPTLLTTKDVNAKVPQPPIPSIRTMAKDIAQSQPGVEPTYSSTQESILTEGKNVDKNATPQWGEVTK